ncbi:MAG: rhombosortase [Thiohalomonadaceae bacterium]
MNIHSVLRSWSLPATLALLSLAMALAGDDAAHLFRYERDAILHGQWWRVFTGHLPHLGWSHLGLNVAGLALVWLLVGQALRPLEWVLVLGVTSLLNGLALLAFMPALQWYVGLSGVLHGLLLAGGLAAWRAGQRDALFIVVLVAGKVAWEQAVGPMPGSETAAGGPVVVEAHAYGAVAGVLAFLLVRSYRRACGTKQR